MAFSGAILAGIWGLIPAMLKTLTKASETVISLLLNYVAGLVVLFLIHGPLKDPASMGWPQSTAFSAHATLPCFAATRIHIIFVIAIGLAIFLSWVSRATAVGLSAKIIRNNPAVAKYAGIPVGAYYLLGFMTAGALAGIAGFGEVSAIHGRLREGISLGYGYAGFFVAWLCGNRFLACIPASILFALIATGADSLQITTGLPFAAIYVFQGLLFVVVLVLDRNEKNGQVKR
jgi:simple sugar transport system permease protein